MSAIPKEILDQLKKYNKRPSKEIDSLVRVLIQNNVNVRELLKALESDTATDLEGLKENLGNASIYILQSIAFKFKEEELNCSSVESIAPIKLIEFILCLDSVSVADKIRCFAGLYLFDGAFENYEESSNIYKSLFVSIRFLCKDYVSTKSEILFDIFKKYFLYDDNYVEALEVAWFCEDNDYCDGGDLMFYRFLTNTLAICSQVASKKEDISLLIDVMIGLPKYFEKTELEQDAKNFADERLVHLKEKLACEEAIYAQHALGPQLAIPSFKDALMTSLFSLTGGIVKTHKKEENPTSRSRSRLIH